MWTKWQSGPVSGNGATGYLKGNCWNGDISVYPGENLPDLSRKIYSIYYHPHKYNSTEVFSLVDDNSRPILNDKKVKFKKNLVGGKKESKKWIILITLFSFAMSAFFLAVSELIFQNASNLIAFITVFIIVFIGIVFDIIGIAVTAADEAPFHAMASRKYFGAKRSLKLIRNANKVSSFCNDVVGDICGIISGTAGALIVMRIAQSKGAMESALYGLIVSGTIAAVTVGGKAMGKTVAISNSNYIAYKVGIVLQFICSKIELLKIKKEKRNRKRGNKTGNDFE